ncbi:tyrosine-type recombinase/integrase [Bifidobacterium sp. ESL0784]|uniref:tyrosine-type recombinase/integrase n=1 Tax=Bifidobacterium sp. ESL0784 TaxID=2983231 RepID=UPI0023F72469|nr:site-specific integrase [Bifidobacterium sp. ESL0784]MDF7641465.1 tyrosine-type recombinase/integrase [Bifidobacterium sp. ESL0784]
MARVFIDDRWLKTADDGTTATPAAKRSLANARDPYKARVPEKWRSSLYGTGKRWRARWYLLRPDGTKIQKSKAFEKLSDAEAYEAGMEDDVRQGRYHDPHQESRIFSEVAEQWLTTKLDIRPGTFGRYKRELRVYINPKWGTTPLRGFTIPALQQWVKSLTEGNYPAELPDGREPKPLSARSIRNIVKVVMSGVFEYAVSNQWTLTNPLKRVTIPKIESHNDDMVLLDISEIELIAEEAGNAGRPTDSLLIRWQAYVGTRIDEALALQVGDLNLDSRQAKIRRTWAEDGNGHLILGKPKSGKSRNVAIPAFLVRQLHNEVNGCRQSDFVFRASRGGPINVHNWRYRVWRKALNFAGMEDEGITIHSLRHSYASIAIANGADVKTLQKQLGHASATITLDTYAGLWPERLNEVADAVNDARDKAIVFNRV